MNESKQELFAVVRVFDRRGPFRPSQTVETGLSREQAEKRLDTWLSGPSTRFVEVIFPQESAPPLVPAKELRGGARAKATLEISRASETCEVKR